MKGSWHSLIYGLKVVRATRQRLEWAEMKTETANTQCGERRVSAASLYCRGCKVVEPVGKRVQSFHIKINKDKLTFIMCNPTIPFLDLPEWSEAYIHKPVTRMFTVI